VLKKKADGDIGLFSCVHMRIGANRLAGWLGIQSISAINCGATMRINITNG